jgi:hypothetical protein
MSDHTQSADTLMLRSEPASGGKTKVIAARNGEVAHIDVLDLSSALRRGQFIKALKNKAPQVVEADVEAELLRLAETAGVEASDEAAGAGGRQESDELLSQMPADVRQEAEAMLSDPDLMKRVIDDVAALGVAGERELTATVYLIGTSRLLDQPLSGIVHGPSSSGKSYLIEKTACLFPPEAVIHATQMTPQALFHMQPGSLSHKFIVAGERSRVKDDERAEATRALREMLSSGKLTKLMPMKVEGRTLETVQIEQDGPIAYVESTTLTKVFDEDANRSIKLHTDEQPKQTRRILTTLAAAYAGASPGEQIDRIVQRHHALQRLLRRQPVVIPFAERLGELFTSDCVQVRRAFPHLMSLIQTVTLLHQRQRQTDGAGRLVASAEDYQLARHLLAKPMARLLGGGVSDPARRFYRGLEKWATGEFITDQAKQHESNCKSSVYGWLHELHEAGVVELVEASRGSRPARWKLTGSPPDDPACVTLPTVEAVFPELTQNPGPQTGLVTTT